MNLQIQTIIFLQMTLTLLLVCHYDCERQHKLRQFNLLNVKQCTEAPSNIQHAKVKAKLYVRAETKRGKAFNYEAHAKRERNVFEVQSNIDVLTGALLAGGVGNTPCGNTILLVTVRKDEASTSWCIGDHMAQT